jgi:Cd2+/Zn2+-exporting ATPase
MGKKCCSTKVEPLKTEEQTSCCSSNQPIQIEQKQSEKTTCCSSNAIDSEDAGDCCNNNSFITEEAPKATTCCSNKGADENPKVSVDCCANSSEILNPVHTDLNQGIKEEFRVYGMDCPACAVTIEKSLSTLQSINGVNVNYSTGKMQRRKNLNSNPSKNK